MEHVKLEVGDKAWFANGGDSFIEGKVVMIVNVDGYSFQHYIIEVSTHLDDYLVIREPTTVTDDPEKPLGIWRGLW